ncbi:MAG: polysaccharide deacetylase family protein [Candidatus Sumerlaeia bacterium]|nr:polysaccharide deacetylase family protein [Candidatus Sumerlaeia bacterium]
MEHKLTEKPPVFVQVDMDGIWAIRRCYGFAEGDGFENDAVYSEALPRILDLLDEYKIKATFFITGKDLKHPAKRDILRKVANAGHEIANHSFNHIVGFSYLPDTEIRREIELTQNIIQEQLGIRAQGFRAPGYDVNVRVWKILTELNFLYDASLLPTPWSSVLKIFVKLFFKKGKEKSGQFGSAGFRSIPLFPFRLNEINELKYSSMSTLWEIPISVSPRLRLPVQVSYAQLLGARHFLRTAESYQHRQLPLTCLIHGIDLVNTDKVVILPDARKISRMFFQLPFSRKFSVVKTILNYLVAHFEPKTPGSWIQKFSPLEKEN